MRFTAHRSLFVAGTAALFVTSALVGCSDPAPTNNTDAGATPGDVVRTDASGDAAADASSRVPPFRNRVEMDDGTLAQAALDIIQAPTADGSTYCGQCHGITRQTIRAWRAESDTALSTCLTETAQAVGSADTATGIIRCLRGGSDTGNFEPARLGIFATAANLDWFRYVFNRAGGANPTMAHAALVDRVVMPPATITPAITQQQFDILAEWFIRGVPGLDDILPEDPRPTTCTQGISNDVRAHVTAMQTRSWATINRERNLLMHGCTGATRPLDCFATAQRARDTEFGRQWDVLPNTSIRVLFTTNYSSAYWTRSSPDGRFVAHGARTSAPAGRFIDLARNVVVPAAGQYDPAFFPDNSGFVFFSNAANVCEQSVLTMGTPTMLSFTEPQCRRVSSIGLYEHVGASLEGSDYWVIDAQFESDDGGHTPTLRNPRAPFTNQSRARLVLMGNTGAGFTQRQVLYVPLPFEGDTTMSPSGRLVATRVAGASNAQLGYVVRRLDVTQEAGQYSATLPEIARFCFTGAKATFSFDERWMIFHHYVTADDATEMGFTGSDDPAFAQYLTRGASNVYLVDLLSGQRRRLTNMQPGQYAHSPHFRADGWINFMVRNAGTSSEYVATTDAALVLAAQ